MDDSPSSADFDQEAIDARLDEFDEAWRSGTVPTISDFWGATEGFEGNPAGGRRLFVNLIMIDLEYRWDRELATLVSGSEPPAEPEPAASDPSPALLSDRHLPERPLLEDYARCFPERFDLVEAPIELIEAEFNARREAGIDCSVSDYARRFPHLEKQIEREFGDPAAVVPTIQVQVFHDRRRVFSTELVGGLEVGRQLPGEPPPYCRTPGEHCDRLIIASTDERYLSRRHLRLELLEDGRVRVSNLSKKNPIAVPHQRRAVGPGHSVDMVPPCLLLVEEKAIRLTHDV